MVAPAEKASFLGSRFDSKQCREQFVTPLSCFPYSRCNTLAFWTPVLMCLLLHLDTYGGVDSLGVFPLFLNMITDIIVSKLSIIFHGLFHRGSFPECCRSANVTAIPKGAPPPDRKNYHPISINPILFKVYEKLVSHRLSSFCENYVFFRLLLRLLIGKVWAARMHS